MAAVAIHFTSFGVRKTLNTEQKAQAADAFGAEGSFLSAGKKLLDTRHEAYKAVSSIRSQIIQFWRAMSVPYPEPGIPPAAPAPFCVQQRARRIALSDHSRSVCRRQSTHPKMLRWSKPYALLVAN
jgi:hypothetical protein